MDKKLMVDKSKFDESQIKKLQDLKNKIIKLKRKIYKQRIENLKQLNIKNLKIFTNTCNFVAPFVISTGMTIGSIYYLGFGLPFHKDEITYYKNYELDYQLNGYITNNVEYKSNSWFDNYELTTNNYLVIYTPWELQEEQYVRFKREYAIGTLNNLDLYNAILDKNYNYILENLTEYQEEKQIANLINSNINNDYYYEAYLYIVDKNDELKYSEKDLQNIIVSIIDSLLGLGLGVIIAYERKFDYYNSLKKINNNYRSKISDIKSAKQELKETKKHILSLRRGKIK